MYLCRSILLKPVGRSPTTIPLRYNTTKITYEFKKETTSEIKLDSEFTQLNPEYEGEGEGEEPNNEEFYGGMYNGEEEEREEVEDNDNNSNVHTVEEQMDMMKVKKLNELRDSIFANIKDDDSKPSDSLLGFAQLSQAKVTQKEEEDSHKVKDSSTIFRDLKLELKVQSLFNDIIHSHEQGRVDNISHKDIERKSKLGEVKQRILNRLGEVKRDNPDNYYSFISTMDEKKLSYLDKEAEIISKGSVPGSLTAPWARRSHLWNDFFEHHTQFMLADFDEDANDGPTPGAEEEVEEDDEDEEGEEDDDGLEDDDSEISELFDGHEQTDVDLTPHFYFLQGWINENFDYPLNAPILETKKKVGDVDTELVPRRCRGRCLFCDPNQPRRVLDPMNIPLLLNFMTPSGYIQSRRRTGMCERMQKRVSRTIKHARNLGLFSYKNGGFYINFPYESKPHDSETKDEDDAIVIGDLDEALVDPIEPALNYNEFDE